MADVFDDDDPFLDNVDIDSLVEQAKSVSETLKINIAFVILDECHIYFF